MASLNKINFRDGNKDISKDVDEYLVDISD